MGKLLKFQRQWWLPSAQRQNQSSRFPLSLHRPYCHRHTAHVPSHAKISGRNKQSLGIRLLYFYILGAHNDINRRADTEFVQYLIDSVMIFSCNDTNLTSLFP